VSSLTHKVKKVIAYFDVFDHPLTEKEIVNLCDNSIPMKDYHIIFSDLIVREKCFEKDGYYGLQPEIEKLIEKRSIKEKEAQKYYKRLSFFVNLIAKFPFVRGIAVSGSLSKGVMYEKGDIDYFIITASERLWVCRTLLVLFKKVFLFNSKKYFCVNYFVDENNLEIADKNMFTAVEVAHLIPVFNAQLIEDLKEKNLWVKEFFPNFKHLINCSFDTSKKRKIKGLELLFEGKLGDKFDLWLMQLTFKRWQKKFSHFNADKFELTMRTNRGISKHHPQDFQNKVLKELSERVIALED